jgi:hypothetical protein
VAGNSHPYPYTSPGWNPISANIMMDARCDTMTIGHATIANLNR